MAVYSGRITDFGQAPIPGLTPQAYIQAVNEGWGPNGEFLAATRKPLTVQPDGSYSMVLVPSMLCKPPTDYLLGVEWLEANGTQRGESVLTFTAAEGGGNPGDMGHGVVWRFFKGANPPASADEGNIWLDTSAGWSYQFKRRIGMSWINVGDPIEGPPGSFDIVEYVALPPGSAPTTELSGPPGARKLRVGFPKGMPGGTGYAERTVSGVTTLTVEPGYTYDLLVSGGATISLTGDGVQNGWQVGIVLSAPATIEGHAKPAGEYVAWRFPEGWRIRDVPQPEPTEVTPLAPVYDDVVGSYTIRAQAGLRWLVNGVERAPGTYSANAPRTLSFVASARNGFVIAGASNFEHIFPTPAAVPTAPDALTGLWGWWDVSDEARTTLVDGKLSQINDKSANNFHLVQATVGSRPPVGAINGRQAITLSNSTSAPVQQIGVTFPPGTPAGSAWPASWTLTVVMRVDAVVAGWGPTVAAPSIQHGGGGNIFGPASMNTNGMTTFPRAQTGQTIVVTVVGSPTGNKLYIDGNPWVTNTTAGNTLGSVLLGATAGGANSSIGEVVAYNRANLTDSDVRNLYAWLKLRWSAR